MRCKAIVFDLDDTLLHDNLTISDYSLSVLRRANNRGIHIIPASGRAQKSMMPFVEQLGCVSAYIACNGAEVWLPDHKLLRRYSFTDEEAQSILSFGLSHDIYTQTYGNDAFYYSIQNHYAESYAAASMLKGHLCDNLVDFVRQHPTSKILMMDEPDKIAEYLTFCINHFSGHASVTCSKPWFLEFNPAKATKGNALRDCAELMGFSIDETIAFGDSLNDLSILTIVGIGVSVQNAREDVRSQTDFVCGSNESDGPAHFIEEFVLNPKKLQGE